MQTPSDDLSSLPASVQNFGKAFRFWRKQSGITQTDVDKITKALSLQGPYGSQVSRLETGQLIPQPFFFQSLARFNQIIAERETSQLQTKQKERLQAAHCLPYKTHDGRVAEAADFFLMYVGQQPLNQAYEAELFTPTSQREVDAFNQMAMGYFQRLCADKGLTPQQGWHRFSNLLSDEQVKREAPGLLFGFDPWDFDQVAKWCSLGGYCPLRVAFEEWGGRSLPATTQLVKDFLAGSELTLS